MIRKLTYLTLRRLAKIQGGGADISVLCKQLAALVCPDELRIGFHSYPVPKTADDYRDMICWGQRIFMSNEQHTDWESFLYFVACYFYPVVTGKEFSDEGAVGFYKKLSQCHVHEIYPVLTRFVNYFEGIVKLEGDKLSNPPDKDMRAAEVDRLKPFTELNILELISQKCRVPLREAHLVEYNIVFSLLWAEKETIAFQKRYNEVLIAKNRKK